MRTAAAPKQRSLGRKKGHQAKGEESCKKKKKKKKKKKGKLNLDFLTNFVAKKKSMTK